LAIALDLVEAYVESGDLERAEEKLEKLALTSKRLRDRPTQERIGWMRHRLGVSAEPDQAEEHLAALREALDVAEAKDDQNAILEVGWVLWRAERAAGVDQTAAERALQAAERLGDRARGAALRRAVSRG
jgi:hypothetical protein